MAVERLALRAVAPLSAAQRIAGRLRSHEPTRLSATLALLDGYGQGALARVVSSFLALRHVCGPRLADFRLNVRKPGARRRIGNANQVIAGRALNLPAGELRFAFQRLIAVGTVEFELGGVHRFRPVHARIVAKSISKRILHTSYPANSHAGLSSSTLLNHAIATRTRGSAVSRCRRTNSRCRAPGQPALPPCLATASTRLRTCIFSQMCLT